MIGIIGAYGNVGLHAYQILKEWGRLPLRLGGRHPEKARKYLSGELSNVELLEVDIEDKNSLDSFVKDCKIVVNCAGPSHRLSSQVAEFCSKRRCHHIDAGEIKNIEDDNSYVENRGTYYCAGAIPGLSGLLPRWLAGSFSQVNSLMVYIGGLDQFTYTGAEDYLYGIFDNTKESVYFGNYSEPTSRKRDVSLPFFPRQMNVIPFKDVETRFVTKNLELDNANWYLVVDGDCMWDTLHGIYRQFSSEPESAVYHLCAASKLDTAGRQTYLNYLIQVDGFKQGRPATQTLFLKTEGSSRVAGVVSAIASISLVSGDLPFTAGAVAAISDPNQFVSRLFENGLVGTPHIFDCSITNLLQEVEGTI